MLARLQQFTTLGLLALALVWTGAVWQAGHPLWALAGFVTIAFGYAGVLAVEFALLHRVHGADPTPRASPALLLRAWCGEVACAPRVFCWRQPFRSHAWPDHLPPSAAGRRGLVLVHGFVCNRGLWNPWLARLHALDIPFVAVDLEPVFGRIDDYVPTIESAVQRVRHATGLAPVIVAHSMGGLALRRWWLAAGEDAPVHHAVTLGTPHRGTWLARFAITPNARQMRQQSHFLAALGAQEPASRAAGFTCFHSHCDNIVFPPQAATLPGADNRHLPGTAHVHMVERPEPWAEVLRWLNRP